MKYTDGIRTVEAVQFRGDRDDTINLQRIGFYPLIVDIRDTFNPKLRVSINHYISKGGYVVKNEKGKYIGYEQSDFLDMFKPVESKSDT